MFEKRCWCSFALGFRNNRTQGSIFSNVLTLTGILVSENLFLKNTKIRYCMCGQLFIVKNPFSFVPISKPPHVFVFFRNKCLLTRTLVRVETLENMKP